MRRDKIEIYLHLIWTTWDREPLITPAWEERIYDLTQAKVELNGGRTLAIGGIADHLHLLVAVSSTTLFCDLVREAKGATSRLVAESGDAFKWRPTYAAFSVSRWNVAQIRSYVRRQKEHHGANSTIAKLEASDEEMVFFDGDWIVLRGE